MEVGFLFDNDGVLIDSTEFHWRSWELLKEERPELAINRAHFIETFGKRNDLILKELMPGSSTLQRQDWAKRKEEIFREIAKKKIALLPGMESFLKQLKEKNIPRIIASSTPLENLEMFIETTVLGQYFDQYISAEQVAHGKPFPDIFVEAATRIHLTPEQCVVLEDSPAGIRAGKAAGCKVVALATTHLKEELSNYDLLVNSPNELDLEQIYQLFKKES